MSATLPWRVVRDPRHAVDVAVLNGWYLVWKAGGWEGE